MKKPQKTIALALVAAFGLLALAACSSADAAKDGLKTVRIATIENPASEAIGLAKNLGYVEEELKKVGFKSEWFNFAQAGPAINEAFASKAIDFASYADFPQLVALNNNINIRAIAPVNDMQSCAILVHKSSGIKTAKDLEGKKIIVPKGTYLQQVFGQYCKEYGVDIDKVIQVNAAGDAQNIFAALEADAILSVGTAVVVLQGMFGGDIIFSIDEKPEWASGYLLSGRGEFLDENPDVAKALLRALYRAYLYAKENPEEVYKSLTTTFINAEGMKKVYANSPDFEVFNPKFTQSRIERIEAANQFLAREALITRAVDSSKLIDTQYYDAVIGEFEGLDVPQ
jgi:sulfonate transport system substrate-binding protein